MGLDCLFSIMASRAILVLTLTMLPTGMLAMNGILPARTEGFVAPQESAASDQSPELSQLQQLSANQGAEADEPPDADRRTSSLNIRKLKEEEPSVSLAEMNAQMQSKTRLLKYRALNAEQVEEALNVALDTLAEQSASESRDSMKLLQTGAQIKKVPLNHEKKKARTMEMLPDSMYRKILLSRPRESAKEALEMDSQPVGLKLFQRDASRKSPRVACDDAG